MSSLPPPPPPSMDSPPPSTPPYHRSPEPRLRSKPNSRLAACFDDENPETQIVPVATPPSRRKSPILPSPLHLHELLLLSPSPHRRTKARSVVEESLELPASMTPRRRGKSRTAASAAASPRNARRARRRLEKEIVREERELGLMEDDLGRVRKRKQSKPKVGTKEKMSLAASAPPPSPSPNAEITDQDDRGSLGGLRERIWELIMWKNVAKSSLWFGLGSIFFISSSFSKDVSFSIISAICHLGILISGVAFFRDSVPQRQQLKRGGSFQLTEEDILRVARVILPMANAAMSKTQLLFSGEPLMTLKVVPVLLLGAKYAHLITLWRLLAAGFFLSFTIPKLYACYSQQIHKRVENARDWVLEAWKSCPRKRFVAASAATMFWNLFSVKTRIIAAFISMVILRYHHQRHTGEEANCESEIKADEQQQAIIVAE
ncbi:reticulon-like protein B17 [Typha angustifolia]|uniref:reticulon-like protein B17 n=1 Tax=Typha angustifolia TaxID=59011 RepID=UPI003C3042A0